MTPKKILLTIALALCSLAATEAQEWMPDDSLGDYHQYVNWEVAAGPNITAHLMHTDGLQDAPDKTTPALGFDAGFSLDYHISQRWVLQFSTIGTVERQILTYGAKECSLSTFGFDVTMPACYIMDGVKGRWTLSAGVFCHFNTGSGISDPQLANPYTRSGGVDIRTGNGIYSLGDFYGGIALGAGYGIHERITLYLSVQAGCTNLLNSNDGHQFITPLKTSLRVAYGW